MQDRTHDSPSASARTSLAAGRHHARRGSDEGIVPAEAGIRGVLEQVVLGLKPALHPEVLRREAARANDPAESCPRPVVLRIDASRIRASRGSAPRGGGAAREGRVTVVRTMMVMVMVHERRGASGRRGPCEAPRAHVELKSKGLSRDLKSTTATVPTLSWMKSLWSWLTDAAKLLPTMQWKTPSVACGRRGRGQPEQRQRAPVVLRPSWSSRAPTCARVPRDAAHRGLVPLGPGRVERAVRTRGWGCAEERHERGAPCCSCPSASYPSPA